MEEMRPHAHDLYRRVFPGCTVEDCRINGKGVHTLDKHFGIDTIIRLKTGSFFTLQEKYREANFIKYQDFTQGYMTGAGTGQESPGEWFKLEADLYFYGWANEDNDGFKKWFLMDVVQYKLMVECAGGLERIGNLRQNRFHSKTSFYSVHLDHVKPCWIATYLDYPPELEQPAPVVPEAEQTELKLEPWLQ